MNPVNDRINNIASKIAGLNVEKLNALNGSGPGGGTASASASAGNLPAAAAAQRGFSATVVALNNDLEEQKKIVEELTEKHKQAEEVVKQISQNYEDAKSAVGGLNEAYEEYGKLVRRNTELQEILNKNFFDVDAQKEFQANLERQQEILNK